MNKDDRTIQMSGHSRKTTFLVYWLPAILWVGLIALLSTSKFSAENTGSVLSSILHLLGIKLDWRRFELLNGLVRKSAHFSVYGILSALMFRAWRGRVQHQRWRWGWAALALLVTLIVASSDEYHQLFTPGRTSEISDVLLDMCGATFAQLMIIAATSKSRVPLD